MMAHVGREVANLSNLIKRTIDQLLNEQGITSLHSWIMIYLKKRESQPVYQRDIEMEFDIRRSSVTSVLQTMERNGLIKRISVKEDARLKQIILTPKAYAITEEIGKSIDKFENSLTADIPQDDLNIFLDVLSKMTSKISS